MASQQQGDIVKKYLKKFPDSKSATLARKIYNENKLFFSDVESVRSLIRYYKGASGKANLKKMTSKDFVVPKKQTTDPFHDFPESYADPFDPYVISQSKTLIISDLHFPYQHNDATKLALRYGMEKQVNCILINGDLFDFAGISRHERNWKQRTVFEEFEAVRAFLKMLRRNFPKAKIVFKEGNHDERWEKWLFLKAIEIFDDPEYKLATRLKLGELGIDLVQDKRPVQIGKLTVLHGHELAGGSGGVNPARATFLKTLESVVVGHYHKTSQHTEVTLGGNVISVHSIGCLCGLNPSYMPINKFNLGFGYVDLDVKTGEYHFQNKQIIKGKVF